MILLHHRKKHQTAVLSSQKDFKKRTPLPPPVIVDDVKTYGDFYDLIKENIAEDLFTTKLMNENRIKVNVKNTEVYRRLVNVLKEIQHTFHTYENKQDKPIKKLW